MAALPPFEWLQARELERRPERTNPDPRDAEIERLRYALRMLAGDSPDGQEMAEQLIRGK